jgi:cephalosporin hydroxylase
MTDGAVTGVTDYRGHMVLQRDGYADLFRKFLDRMKPDRIVEIGTASGGLTLTLADLIEQMKLHCVIRSYDIARHAGVTALLRNGVQLITVNLFDDTYRCFNQNATREVVSLIEFIRQPGKTVVMCDGGNKVAEFNLLAGVIKDGDHIMAHDFAWSENVFKSEIENKIWNWHQISGDDVFAAIDKNSLKPFWSRDFEQYAWLSMVRRREDGEPTW